MHTISKALVASGLALALTSLPAHAIPVLQVYIEGATYDSSSETWVFSGSGPLRLWAIGNVDGPGGQGAISDVRLAVAYSSVTPSPTITLTPSTTGGFGGFVDPSTPAAPTHLQTVTDGSRPLLSDGDPLPGHGIYGSGTHWQEFLLGNFTLEDSPMADFITSFPSAPADLTGQINVYEVSVSGASEVHFDLYDSVMSGNKARAVFAPFSHDGEGTPPPPPPGQAPEPGTLSLLGLGLLAFAFRRRLIRR